VQLGLIKVWDEFLEDYGDKKVGIFCISRNSACYIARYTCNLGDVKKGAMELLLTGKVRIREENGKIEVVK